MDRVNIDSQRQVLKDVQVGKNVKIYNFVNAYGCSIGDDSKIGSFVEIQKGATIGSHCKISSHSFICEGVHIGNRVFIGHNVTFINDKYPRATNATGGLQNDQDWKLIETFVEEGATIGSSVTLMCGVRIGEGAIVGAGSLVLEDVPPFTIVAGHPAKILRHIGKDNAI